MQTRKIWTFPTQDFLGYGEDNRYDTGRFMEHKAIDMELLQHHKGVYLDISIYTYNSLGLNRLAVLKIYDYELPNEEIFYLQEIYDGNILGRFAESIMFSILTKTVFNNQKYEQFFPKLYEKFKDIPTLIINE